jgi:hypothetical protein
VNTIAFLIAVLIRVAPLGLLFWHLKEDNLWNA